MDDTTKIRRLCETVRALERTLKLVLRTGEIWQARVLYSPAFVTTFRHMEHLLATCEEPAVEVMAVTDRESIDF